MRKKWVTSAVASVVCVIVAASCIASKSPVLFVVSVSVALMNGALAVYQYNRRQ